MPGQHVFISYSRKDTDFVTRLAASLIAASIPVWLDKTDLTPGTPNWEQAIRTAIDEAAAVVLVASPDSRASVYVQGELSLAKIRQRPVYPVWVDGSDWIDCIPLDMVNYQYVDCRKEAQETGFQNIARSLMPLFTSTDTLVLGLPTHETVELNIRQFKNLRSCLDFIYVNYLQDWYEPNTYGRDWILGNVQTKQLAVPWRWLTLPAEERALSHENPQWGQHTSLKVLGLHPKSYWAVWEASRLRAAGIAVNDEEMVKQLLSAYGVRELRLLRDAGIIKLSAPQRVEADQFRYLIVMAMLSSELSLDMMFRTPYYDRMVFVQVK